MKYLLMLVFLFSGCTSKPQPSAGYILPDYSQCTTIESELVNEIYTATIVCDGKTRIVKHSYKH